MPVDRRTFLQASLAAGGAAIVGFPAHSGPVAPRGRVDATLLVDAASGRVLHRSGASAQRFSPCSTFKIPLALMGFDSGILTDAHHPAWDYRPGVHRANRAVEKQRTDPASWETNSVVWYSQEITRKLGMARFAGYVRRFGYGNGDLAGNPGRNDGLTHAWLGSSLAISADEQVAFLRRMLAHRLVAARAHGLAESVIPGFAGSGGWQVHGKTGTGPALGWFVGWADKGKRRVVFARLLAGDGVPSASGMAARKALLAAIGRIAG